MFYGIILRMKRNSIIGALMLALCAFIWGLTFVAQSEGADHFSPMWFTCLRNVIAVAVLKVYIAVTDIRKKKAGVNIHPTGKQRKKFYLGGMACGLSLCVASYLQQLGITLGTEAGKAGFITALYIMLVPIFSIFLKKRPPVIIWICAAASIFGLYLLCVKGDAGVKGSDFIVLACAFMFTVQIMVIDAVSPAFDGVKLACMQFFFCAVFSFIYAVIFEDLDLQSLKAGIIPLLYAGIFSSGIAYTLQITGQKRLENPTVASMIMSFESVFGAIASAVILHQIMTGREIIGCAIMFAAIIAAQLPVFNKKEPAEASVGKKETEAN